MTNPLTSTKVKLKRGQLSNQQLQDLFNSYNPKPDAIELNGCLVVGTDYRGKEIVEPVFNNEQPEFWAIYWHLPGHGLEWLEDFNTLEEAETEKLRVEKICNLPTISDNLS